jgi:hypothetical protein
VRKSCDVHFGHKSTWSSDKHSADETLRGVIAWALFEKYSRRMVTMMTIDVVSVGRNCLVHIREEDCGGCSGNIFDKVFYPTLRLAP